MTLPKPLFYRLIRTTVVMWFLVRVAVIAVGVVSFSPPEAVAVSLIVLFLIWVDIRAFRERDFLANLAVSPFLVSALVLSSALTLEILAAVSVGAAIRDLVSR